MATLTFAIEDGQEVVVPIAGRITVGRGDANDVVLDDAHVSWYHAELECLADGRIELRDLGSTSGTFVNGRSIKTKIVSKDDAIAFGPIAARIDLDKFASSHTATIQAEEERLTKLRAEIRDAEAAQRDLISSIRSLTSQHDEKAAAIRKLDETRDAEKREIAALTAAHEDQVKAARKKFEQLIQEQQRAQESVLDLQAELKSRENDLAAETKRLDEARARRAEIEAQCELLATTEQKLLEASDRLVAIEQQHVSVQASLTQSEARLADQDSALQKITAAENAAQDRITALSARERDHQNELEQLNASLEAARSELSGLESNLTPLRDWKAAMDRRFTRLAALPKDSNEERLLWDEIEEAYSALLKLLTTAGVETTDLTPGDFTRLSARSGVMMKSERIRRAGTRTGSAA